MSQYTSLFTDSAEEEPVEPRDKVQPYTILIVDDEPNIVNALRRVFRQENYRILTASNGQEALDVLVGDNCQLMIADYMMPVMNGAELLRTVKQRYPDMIRIMLTGHADTEAVMSAIKEGAVYKFILKPWNDDDLRVTVALALEQYDLMQSNRNLQKQNRASAKEINELSRLSITNRSQLAILLHKRNLLNEQQVQELYKLQQSNRQPVLKLILKKEWVEEKKIRELLRKDFMIREVSLDEVQIDAGILALIPRSLCERHLVLPLEQHNRKLTLVMADPMDEGLLDDLKFAIGLDIEPAMADVDAIRAKLNEIYGEEDTALDDIAMVLGSL